MIKRYYRNFLYALASFAAHELDKLIPPPKLKNLSEKHLKNCKLLPDRLTLLSHMKSDATIAEVGVFKGDFSKKILDTCSPNKLHLIDSWASARYNNQHLAKIQNDLSEQIKNEQVHILREMSVKAATSFEDHYFDWIYIDTDHSYKTTRDELESYRNKVKPGGIISGHDYCKGNWFKLLRYGVIEAVNEFCQKYDWEIIYLTHEIDDNPSFAIRKISTGQ